MQVKLNVSRSDITWFNVSNFLRLKTNLGLFAFTLLVAAFFTWRGMVDGGGQIEWMVLALGSLAGGVVGFLAIFLFSLVFVLLNSTTKSGVLGEHTYTIEDAGLREETEANDTLHFWPSIQKIEKSKRSILIQINPWLYHVLPYRAFENGEQFDLFFDVIEKYKKAHLRD